MKIGRDSELRVLWVGGRLGDARDAVAAQTSWSATSVATAEEALAQLDEEVPEVVVSETDLPGDIDGVELARRAKSDPRTRHVPIVLVTRGALSRWGVDVERAGVSAFVADPPDAETLVVAIDSALAIAQLLSGRRAERADGKAGPRSRRA
jgi:CheY-like chemotaxis protein